MQDALPKVGRMNVVRKPLVVRFWAHAGVERQVGCPLALLEAGVDRRRVDQENRVAKRHRFRIEVGKEVPEEWMGNDPLAPYPGDKGNAVARSVFDEAHRGLDLERERRAELSAGVNFLVAPVVIRKRCCDFEPAAAAHHHELGRFGLADGPLLDLPQAHKVATAKAPDSGVIA